MFVKEIVVFERLFLTVRVPGSRSQVCHSILWPSSGHPPVILRSSSGHPLAILISFVLFHVAVACSTVTVTKCQAALRTLQAFPFFNPTCLCREPAVDPECNSFRDFLYDHPCIYVLKKGE